MRKKLKKGSERGKVLIELLIVEVSLFLNRLTLFQEYHLRKKVDDPDRPRETETSLINHHLFSRLKLNFSVSCAGGRSFVKDNFSNLIRTGQGTADRYHVETRAHSL